MRDRAAYPGFLLLWRLTCVKIAVGLCENVNLTQSREGAFFTICRTDPQA